MFNISRNDLERRDAEERRKTIQRCQRLSSGGLIFPTPSPSREKVNPGV